MANNVSENSFRNEMLVLMKSAVAKIEENADELGFLRKQSEKNNRELKGLKELIRDTYGFDKDARLRVI